MGRPSRPRRSARTRTRSADRPKNGRAAPHGAALLHEAQIELVANLLGDIDRVFLVPLGEEHDLDTRAVSREDLLLDAADRQHPSGEGDLAGHGDVVARRTVREGGDQGRGHGHARRGAVLRDRSGRDVHVVIDLHAGPADATIWTNDLTHDYVHENSAYST